MILSSIQAHPSMHSSYVQNIRTSSTFRKISTLTSPVASPFRTNPSLELYLLSLLKGEQKPCEERVSIGAEISALSDEQKIGLITFLKDIATRPAVEDCACKMLQCTKTQFAQVFLAQSDRTRLQVFLHDEDCVQKISTLWEKLYTDIIPTMEDIVFPLTDTLEQLENKIFSNFTIAKEKQILFFESGEELAGLSKTSLTSLGLKEGSKVVVKHANLDNWVEMTAYAEEALQAKSIDNMGRIISSVEAALPHLKLLTLADFFTSYPRFGPKLRSFKSDFGHYLDSDDKHIKFALQEYFSKLLGDNAENPTIVVNCEEKTRGGIQGGVIANVSSEGNVLGRFYVKVHIGLAVYPYDQNADLREIFAYKLLELIKLAPKVHFVPNVHYSMLGLYICTEEVIGFRQANEVDMSDDQMSERELIRRILVLKDLHSVNYGVDVNGKLSIIDFKVGDNYGKAEKYWAGENRAERQRVARQCFESWQLEPMIIVANDSIFQQKQLFRKNGILYKPSRDYSNYLAEIRKNIVYISDSL